MRGQATDSAVAAGAQKVSVGGGTVAFFGGLSANEIAAFGGLLIALVGLLVQWHYKHKSDKRATRLYEKRLAKIEAGEAGEEDDE